MKICFWNNEQLCSAAVAYDVGLPGHVWHDAPVDYDENKYYKLNDGEVEETLVAEYDPKRLRVHRSLPQTLNPLISDFSILGFRKMSPSYDRGKKIRAEYKCIDKDEMVVEKIFTDLRDQNGILTGLQVTFNWYAEDGTIELSKTDEVKQYNKYEAETEERKRRYRQFDYLRASAKGTPNEPYIAMIINHYSVQISKYQDDGLTILNDDMIAETDPTISAILAAAVPRNDGQGDTTVMKAIQYQMGTITLEDL